MEDCCEEAHEAHMLLRTGTKDLPRMKKVLESQRVFLLVDEGTVKKYKADLTEEIEPAINELIERAEQGLQTLYQKESVLQTKLENAQSRPPRHAAGAVTSHKLETRRLQMLSKQRKRLEEELQALTAEVQALELQR